MNNTINKIESILEQAGASGITNYINKLNNNIGSKEIFEDLLWEARIALMFLKNGFSAELRDRPDLSISLANEHFYAEVKHMRIKRQDLIDESNLEIKLSDEFDMLIPYGDTEITEGKAAWEQIVCIAKTKIGQYYDNDPYLLVVGSSSLHCLENDINTPIHDIEERVVNDDHTDLIKLSGMMLIDEFNYCIRQRRNVYFQPMLKTNRPLSQHMCRLLNDIKYCPIMNCY